MLHIVSFETDLTKHLNFNFELLFCEPAKLGICKLTGKNDSRRVISDELTNKKYCAENICPGK